MFKVKASPITSSVRFWRAFFQRSLEVIDCVANQFEPLSDVSYNVLDGELLEDGPVQARLTRGGVQFFAGEGVE